MRNDENSGFVCPECGSTEASTYEDVSTDYDPQNPWSGVLERITCAKCDFLIPAHLGERWGQMSVEEARQEWQDVYRETAWRSSDPDNEGEEGR